MLRFLKGPVLYVRIRRNRFLVRNVSTGKELDLAATTPFSHPRYLVGDYTAAESLLREGVRRLRGFLPPRILLHPLELIEGGLSQVEERIFLELAYGGAKAARAAIWLGRELRDDEVAAKLP